VAELPSLDEIRARWPEVVALLADRDPRTSALAAVAEPRALDRRFLALSVPSPVHKSLVNQRLDQLREAVVEVFGDVWVLRCDADFPEPRVGQDPVHLYQVPFTPEVSMRIAAEAERRGVAAVDLVRALVEEALPEG